MFPLSGVSIISFLIGTQSDFVNALRIMGGRPGNTRAVARMPRLCRAISLRSGVSRAGIGRGGIFQEKYAPALGTRTVPISLLAVRRCAMPDDIEQIP